MQFISKQKKCNVSKCLKSAIFGKEKGNNFVDANCAFLTKIELVNSVMKRKSVEKMGARVW